MPRVHVCPWWLTYTFDNPLRRLLHDPVRVVAPFVRPGDRVADVGCGMGHFTLGLARAVGPEGRVLAVDLQARQLAVVARRARRAGLQDRVRTRLAAPGSLPLDDGLAFVLAFWMLHEVPDLAGFLAQVRTALLPGGGLLVAEPRIHVDAGTFADEMAVAREAGFAVRPVPGIRISHAALLLREASLPDAQE
jgi:ubiquinone/menaquinone biosynthesis C-methylase UbiE